MATTPPGLAAEIRARASAVDGARLAAAEAALAAAIEEHFAARSAHTDHLLAPVSRAMWEVARAWAEARGKEETSLPLAEIGRWRLSPRESAWVNAGFAEARFVEDAGIAETLQADLFQIFDREPADLEIHSMADAIQVHYREALGADAALAQDAQAAEFDCARAELRAAIVRAASAQRELLPAGEERHAALATQERLARLLPHVAHLARLARKGGFGAEDRRTEIKVRETAQRLRMKVHESISNYDGRKQYERIEGEILDLLVRVEELEEREQARRATLPGGGAASAGAERLAALEGAVESVRAKVRAVTRTTSGEEPPFLLRHRPRLTPAAIAEKWRAIFAACPRLRAAHAERWYPRVRVCILPGQGDAIFDARSGAVVATLFPLAAKEQAIVAAIGECYLQLDSELHREFQRFMLDRPPRDESFRETFRKSFVAWVGDDGGRRGALEPELERWFHQHLVLRRTPAEAHT